MITFRGIKVVAVRTRAHGSCFECIALTDVSEFCSPCKVKFAEVLQPASLHDGRPRVVLTGGRKPSFPIKAVWFRNGGRDLAGPCQTYAIHGHPLDILAVERADEGEEK